MLNKYDEFDDHKIVSYVYDPKTKLQGFIAIHSQINGYASFGATRMVDYTSSEEALKDTLRLSRLMSYKSAISGIKHGGAKAVIFGGNKTGKYRNELLKAYARKVNLMGGNFVTGTDVGVTDNDIKIMRRMSKHFVGVVTDPARYTALGVFLSLKEALKEVFGNDNLKNRSFAIQGVGKTGSNLLKLLYKEAKEIYFTDIDKTRVNEIIAIFPNAQFCRPEEIHSIKVDVFSPCAMYHTINKSTINEFNCSIIAGSANNQLEKDDLGDKLYKYNILYLPDFVINAGGLISVVDEYENGNSKVKRMSKRIEDLRVRVEKIISQSKKHHKPTNIIANEMAQEIIQHYV